MPPPDGFIYGNIDESKIFKFFAINVTIGVTMPKLVEQLDRNTQKIHPVVDPVTVDKINELLKTGDFRGLSDLIRKSVEFLYMEYKIKGKLKPSKTAEEIADEIEQKKHKPVREECLGEEEIR